MVTENTKKSSCTERSFAVHHQSVFVEDTASSDGIDETELLEIDDTPFETTLSDHGLDIDTQARTPRIDSGGGQEFIDDRPLSAIRASNGGDGTEGRQEALFVNTEVDQRTLGGGQANARCLFETEPRQKSRLNADEE
ncbi:hypothetical protein [Haloarcula rubra]|uniref:hypothetical protein n=1 Tax=Haloarcula rubra TaxID=2487747 RepID=UPI001C73413E|nr:hypothetical protein [Halomicroarcula rubra]